jgi:cation diffusion facilitator family transporter
MSNESHASTRILAVTTVGSALLCAGLAVAHLASGSELALAHAADSGFDTVTALVLAWAVRVASAPRDAEHPFGHSRAEPLAALFVAFLAGALAFEVGRDAVSALLGEHDVQPSGALWIVAAKAAFKLGVLAFASRGTGPALHALKVDARNDVLTSVVAGLGIWGATLGRPDLDAWLALPLAAWIAWSGFELAADNVRRLMGESPPQERIGELERAASEIEGVRGVHELRAHYLGTRLQIHVHVVVDEEITVKAAHDIGELVRERLEGFEDVAECSVHIDVEDPEAEARNAPN